MPSVMFLTTEIFLLFAAALPVTQACVARDESQEFKEGSAERRFDPAGGSTIKKRGLAGEAGSQSHNSLQHGSTQDVATDMEHSFEEWDAQKAENPRTTSGPSNTRKQAPIIITGLSADSSTDTGRWLGHESMSPYRAWYQELISNSQTHTFGIGGTDKITGDFVDLYKKNAVVKRITLFESGNDRDAWLKGVELEFTDLSVVSKGQSSFNTKSYVFAEGETLIGNVQMCGGIRGVGYFKFCTVRECFSGGQSFNRDIFDFPADGRILTGLFGWFGEDIDAMGPIVSRKIESSQLLHVKYNGFPLNQVVPMSKIQNLGHFVIRNESGLKVTHKISFERAKTSTISHTSEDTHHIKAHLQISTKYDGLFPLVLGSATTVEVGFEYGYQWKNSHTDSIEKLERVEVDSSIDVPPYTQSTVTIYQVQENLNLPYTATLDIDFGDGTESQVNVSGVLAGVLVSSTQTVFGKELYIGPTSRPTHEPTIRPTAMPTKTPTEKPSSEPTPNPTTLPSKLPTKKPSSKPTQFLSNFPSTAPSYLPSKEESAAPSLYYSTPRAAPAKYNMTACHCNAQNECLAGERLSQGSQLLLCLMTASTSVYFYGVKDLVIRQGDISFHPITAFIPNEESNTVTNGNTATISTKMVPALFHYRPPAKVEARGVAVLKFKNMDEIREVSFTVELELNSSGKGSNPFSVTTSGAQSNGFRMKHAWLLVFASLFFVVCCIEMCILVI